MAYGDDQGLTSWLAKMGYALPAGSPPPAALRARASAYLDAVYEPLLTGERTGGLTQEDAWPRTGATVRCKTPVPSDLIPPAVVSASYRAAWLEASEPGVLAASMTAGQRIAREKVDVIEVAYHNDGAAGAGAGAVAFLDSEIDGAMRQFICDDTGGNLGIWAIGR